MKHASRFVGLALLYLVLTLAAACDVDAKQVLAGPLEFSFGAPMPGHILVTEGMVYSSQAGFGFEAGTALKSVHGTGTESAQSHAVASDKPFFFSVAVPEGNYKVTVTLGNPLAASETTVLAELRRLMLQQIHTDAGQFQTRSFIVNVRQAAISTGGRVRLKDREKATEAWNWDDRLTLEFIGVNPSISTLKIEKADVPVVFIMGDSTVCDQPSEPFNSWGQMLPRFFKPDVAIANHAESGESIASSLGAGRFNKIWSQMKKGDYLFVQFGHNDMKSKAANALQSYTDNLAMVVDKAQSLGGIPVICTPVSRRTFGSDGKISNSFDGYPEAVRSVARKKNVPLIDLQPMTAAFYEALGPEAAVQAFANASEHTHHGDYGSYEIAKCVLLGIQQNKLGIASNIVDDFTGFDPSHPDSISSFTLPKSSSRNAQTPLGN